MEKGLLISVAAGIFASCLFFLSDALLYGENNFVMRFFADFVCFFAGLCTTWLMMWKALKLSPIYCHYLIFIVTFLAFNRVFCKFGYSVRNRIRTLRRKRRPEKSS